MEPEKMLVAIVLTSVVIVGLVIGVSVASAPSGTSNNGSGSSQSSLSPDTDFGQSKEAPDWGLLMSDGKVIQMSNLEGKFAIVDLMSLTCPACETQNGEIVSLISAMGDRIHVISLSVDVSTTTEQMQSYKDDASLTWEHGLDTNSVFTYYFKLRYTPTVVIIDSDGYFRMYHEGVWTSSEIQQTLSLLDQ
ncbi:MAG: TlpA family protein disulfide reductase [Candidatus Thorarchaeota archaeon]